MRQRLWMLMTTWLICLLTACSYHLQGSFHIAKPLQRLYLQTPDPYGTLARSLRSNLLMSGVTIVNSPDQATTILNITRDDTAQVLLSVSGTQQTRQYNLVTTVVFEITKKNGEDILGPQTLSETRTITIQVNQILGSSNEANLFYDQMRRALATAILRRITSTDVTDKLNNAFSHTHKMTQP